MTNLEKHESEKEKIIAGLKLAYERLIEYKKAKKSVLVVMRKNKIVEIKPRASRKK